MPTRYLKPGVCDSEAIDNCSALAEVFFYRLLVNVDDFGRIDARPALLKSKCFPIKDNITKNDVDAMIAELASNGLIIVYESRGKQYLQMQKWDNTPRAKESKCPAFDSTCIQMYADANASHTVLPVTVTETVTKTVTETVNSSPQTSSADVLFNQFWQAYPKKTGKQAALKAWSRIKDKQQVLDACLVALGWQAGCDQWRKEGGQFIPNPSTYLTQGRWDDLPTNVSPLPARKVSAGDRFTEALNNIGETKQRKENDITAIAVRVD